MPADSTRPEASPEPSPSSDSAPRSPGDPGFLSKLLYSLISGLFGGGIALGADRILASVLLGSAIPWTPGLEWFYLGVGALFGLITLPWAGHHSEVSPTGNGGKSGAIDSRAMALAFAGLYSLPIFERLFDAAEIRLAPTLGQSSMAVPILASLVGVLGILALVAMIRELGRLTRHPAAGAWIAGTVVACGLAVNRNLVGHPLEARALIADAVIIGLGLAVAWWVRSRGLRSALILTSVASVFVFAALAYRWVWIPVHTGPLVPSHADRPNLILLVIDTLRADVFDAVLRETEEGRTFAGHFEDAVFFENAQAAAPWTAPSMGSILTGLYPDEHGFGNLRTERDPNRTLRPLAPHVPTLASRLRQRGYATEAIIANPILYPGSGIDRGFDRFEVLDSTIKKMPLLMVMAQLGILEIADYQPAPRVTARMEGRLDDLMDEGRPFFLWLQYLDPHEPIIEHPELGPDPAAAGLDEEARLYRDEVRFNLIHLDRAIRSLKAAEVWDESLVILVSDHGEMHHHDGHVTPVRDPESGDFLRRGHGKALYREIVRIPLVIRPPGGVPPGAGEGPRRVDALVSHLDLHDTVADLLDVGIPEIGRDRISLAPYLETSEARSKRRNWALLGGIQAGIPQRSLVTPKRKLVIYDREKPPELYDLVRDPLEQRNLAAHPRVDVESWIARLEAHWAELHALEDDGEAADLDPETRKRLQALGYLQ